MDGNIVMILKWYSIPFLIIPSASSYNQYDIVTVLKCHLFDFDSQNLYTSWVYQILQPIYYGQGVWSCLSTDFIFIIFVFHNIWFVCFDGSVRTNLKVLKSCYIFFFSYILMMVFVPFVSVFLNFIMPAYYPMRILANSDMPWFVLYKVLKP